MSPRPKRLNIGIVHSGEFPWNRGIAQLYSALDQIGHRPTVLSRVNKQGNDNPTARHFRFDNMRNRSGFLARVLAYPIFLNPFWETFIFRNALRLSFDCIFLRETTLLRQTLSASRKAKLPILVDMRENDCLKAASSPSFYSQLHSRLIRLYESLYLPRCDHIFVVTEELREWVAGNYNIRPHRINVLGNYPDTEFISRANSAARPYTMSRPAKLVFAGMITENRGLQDIIDSFPLLLRERQCTFTIIGEGNFLPVLRNQVTKLGLESSVFFTPMLPPEKVAAVLSTFDIGVAPYLLNDYTNQTMPGKLYEYMAVGLPVLSSARKPVVRVIKEEHCGVIYQSRDPEEIVRKIITMVDNPDHCQTMSANGREAIASKYNSGAARNLLAGFLKDLLLD